MLHAVQPAFYAKGSNVTHGESLAGIGAVVLAARGMEIDTLALLAWWSSEKANNATRDDFL